jgi:succinate dehydrogenase hydrophobic anchor subunit
VTTATRSEREGAAQAKREIKAREREEKRGPLSSLWANYSLSIVFLALFAVALVGHAWFGWMQYSADQASHGQAAELWGEDGYWVYFGEWTLQNWQSEFLQSLLMVALAAWFIHRGSAESKDSQEEMQATLERIEQRLGSLEGGSK